jgi:Ca-activated chloride channel family protein
VALITRSKRGNLPRSFYLSITLLLVCSVSAYSQSRPSRPSPANTVGQSPISVVTDLVVLPVSVTDANGDFVPGLSLQNFRVYEDGRLQTVTSFQQEDTPVTVGLIVDHSRSMVPKLPEVAAAVSVFARSSNSQDEMFVIDFNDVVWIEPLDGKPFTNDAKILEKAVSGGSTWGKTALYDAVTAGLNHLQLGHLDKKALIIVSDGGDNASEHKYSQVLDLARRDQVTIYAVGLMGSNEEEDANVLRRLCRDTGGIAYFPGSEESVTDVSKQIARDLREQYTLAFAPEKANVVHLFRKIEVKVASPGHRKLHVRTRRGYFGVEQKPSPTSTGRNAS